MDALTRFLEIDQEELKIQKRVTVVYLSCKDEETPFTAFRKQMTLLRKKISDSVLEPPAGEHVVSYVGQQLEQANVIILFLSAGFEADERYTSQEMKAVIDRCYEKGIRIWPIIARPYHWGASNFKKYGIFFDRDKAITSANNADELLKQIVGKIDGEVSQMLAEEWSYQGNAFFRDMHYEEALKAYNTGLFYMTDHPYTLLGKWRVLSKMGIFEEARVYEEKIFSYNAVIQHNAKEVSWLNSDTAQLMYAYCKARMQFESGKVDEASEEFEKLRQQAVNPIDKTQRRLFAEIYRGLGETLLKRGDYASGNLRTYYSQAIDAFREANHLSLEEPAHLCKIGDLYLSLGEQFQANNYHEEALRIYQQVIDSYPDYIPAIIGQGNVYYRLKMFGEALSTYKIVLQHDEHNMLAYSGKGWVLLVCNKPTEALAVFEQALLQESSNANCLYGKGQALASLQQYEEAREAYTKAYDCGVERSTDFFMHYAQILMALGDRQSIRGQETEADTYYAKACSCYDNALKQGGNSL